jgi:hypothetical protein
MVSFPNDFMDTEYSVLEAICIPFESNLFDAVSDGHLRVVGKLLRVQWSQVSHKSDPRNSKDDQAVLVLIRKGLKEPLDVSFDSNWPPTQKTDSYRRIDGETRRLNLFYFMLGCRKRGVGRDSPAPMGLVYLFLQCVDEVKQIYERVGIRFLHV